MLGWKTVSAVLLLLGVCENKLPTSVPAGSISLTVLKGSVSRNLSNNTKNDQTLPLLTKPVANAVVQLCRHMETCGPIATTVSDSVGAFVLLVDAADRSGVFSIRTRAIGGTWATKQIGSWQDLVSTQENITLTVSGEDRAQLFSERGEFDKAPTYGKVSVLFGTDRAIRAKPDSVEVMNTPNKTGVLEYGKCEVAVETNGVYDRAIEYFGGRNAEKYYSVQSIVLMNWPSAWQALSRTLSEPGIQDALLFIHGYNTSFDDACRRAAQMAYDLKFRGPVILYSWPSHNSVMSYAGDEEMAEWSGPHFTKLLQQVLSRPGLGHLHIVAHSMGNRILARTLFSNALTPKQQSHIGEIVFAAPDINRLVFDGYPDLSTVKASRVTLYASDHDQALRLSKWFHGYLRAGDSRPSIETKTGMDAVDASAVDTSLLGHSYIGQSRSVLVDLAALIQNNTPPDRRFGTVRRSSDSKAWWELTP